MYKCFIKLLDKEIVELVKEENEAGELHEDRQEALHILLENRKHIKGFIEEKGLIYTESSHTAQE